MGFEYSLGFLGHFVPKVQQRVEGILYLSINTFEDPRNSKASKTARLSRVGTSSRVRPLDTNKKSVYI